MITSARLTGSGELLQLDGIGVRLSGREILNDVSFAIRPGEFTGLIGPNGAGKTTILRVILGLQPPSSGTVTVAGAEPGRRPGRRHRFRWSGTCRRSC
jgi:ABC-type multidrug transport system ATPase subunit